MAEWGSQRAGGASWGAPAAQNNFSGGTSSWSSQKKPQEPQTEYAFSPAKLIAGLTGGAAGGVTAWYLLDGLRAGNGSSPLSFAAAVTLIACCIACAVRLAAFYDGSAKHLRKTEPKAHFARRCLAFLAGIFLLSGLFEFLYELGGADYTAPSSYVLVLDTSGSMAGGTGDAAGKAAADVIAGLDDGFPYAVYTFSSDVQCIKPMHAKTAQDGQTPLPLRFEGMTALYGALDKICTDYEEAAAAGTWQGGDVPRVLLFSDGAPTDDTALGFTERGVLSRLCDNRMTVSALYTDGADIRLMKKIAERTGGVALHISNTGDLRAAMEHALTESAGRTLFSVRPVTVRGWIYAVMRLLFLSVLGGLFAWVIYYAGCLRYDLDRAIITKIITGILSALTAEIGTQAIGLTEPVICTVFAVFAGIALLHTVYEKPEKKPAGTFTPGKWNSGKKQPQEPERREIHDKNAGGGLWK